MLIRRQKKTLAKLIFLTSFLVYCTCADKGQEYYSPYIQATHPAGGNYVGSITCRECHQDIYKDHIETAHYHTSAVADAENIGGSFKKGKNTFALSDATLEMVREGKSHFQESRDKKGNLLQKQQFDVVIGSGVKGKSYLTWQDDHLFQLQASYNAPADSWINSPGYPDRVLQRPIRDACLKCHVTHATNRDFSGTGNEYNQDRMIYGIGCERCHGPAEDHVVFHRNNPDSTLAHFILRVDTLPQPQRLDLCAQCHSGPRDNIIKGNSFSYLPGEDLQKYSRNFYTGQAPGELDVHGNQFGLLTSSPCFLSSPEMDCGTCHDSHKNQRGDSQHFINSCNSCHETSGHTCSASLADQQSMGNNCVSCHMPSKPSTVMAMQGGENLEEKPVLVRTHLIGIYAREEWRP